jgi:hypothetical protein
MPTAPAFDTVKVTGPAGTVVVSSTQRLLPPLLVIATLTALLVRGAWFE